MTQFAFLRKTTQVFKQFKANVPLPEQKFDFSPVSEEKVTKYLNRIGLRKATGLDGWYIFQDTPSD